MPAIITDQFRILNAETFVKSFVGIGTTSNTYYTFLGHPNPINDDVENYGSLDWSTAPPAPKDSFQQENLYHDSMMFMKKVNSTDVARVIPRHNWTSGSTFDMYKGNVDINNASLITKAKSLYEAKYVVVNSEFKVYLCTNNGANPDQVNGVKSLYEPNFVATTPQQAGAVDDGYRWKYLYTINPTQIVKFTTDKFIPVPSDWGDTTTQSIKNAAVDGKIDTIIIKNRGTGFIVAGGSDSATIANVPILGDGTGGLASVTINGGAVTGVEVTNGGSGYTRALLKFGTTTSGSVQVTSGVGAEFEVIIPPSGGHGHDIYRELGSHRVMLYSKYDAESDYITGNTFSRVGIIKNPVVFGSTTGEVLNTSTATSLGALKLKPVGSGNTSDTTYPLNALITQEVGVGSTAIGYVASWNATTGILKYYQPVGLTTDGFKNTVDNKLFDFVGIQTTIQCNDGSFAGQALEVDTSFDNQNTITVGGKIVELGQTFIDGKSNPEVKRYSGEIIYIDNRAPITRSASQKEEVKVVVEF